MNNINEFLERNNLKQIDLVRYLGISKPYMSQVANGTARLSAEKLTKLINNDRGWDVSMLMEQGPLINQSIGSGSNNTQVVGSGEIAILKEKIELLEKLLEEKERTIQILMSKNNNPF